MSVALANSAPQLQTRPLEASHTGQRMSPSRPQSLLGVSGDTTAKNVWLIDSANIAESRAVPPVIRCLVLDELMKNYVSVEKQPEFVSQVMFFLFTAKDW